MVGHKHGSRPWPCFRSLCFGSFQQLGAHNLRGWCLVLCWTEVPSARECHLYADDRTDGVRIGHAPGVGFSARACVRGGLAATGFITRRDACLASTSKQMLRARPAAQINCTLVASLGRTVCYRTVFTVIVGRFPLLPLQFLQILFK